MTSSTVLDRLGRPLAVKPIVTSQSSGEAWIYRRVANRYTQETATQVDYILSWAGPGSEMVKVPHPVARPERVVVYQMTALLIVDGKVVSAKQWKEEDRNFF